MSFARYFLVVLLLATTSFGVSAQSVPGTLERLRAGQTVDPSMRNTVIMGAAIEDVGARCNLANYSRDFTRVSRLVSDAKNIMIFGERYKEEGGWANASAVQATYIASAKYSQERIACGAPAAKFVGAVESSLQQKDAAAGKSNFVKGCTRQFTSQQCSCVVSTARSVIPDIENRPYDRMIFKEITNRNPFIGLTVATRCGITRY